MAAQAEVADPALLETQATEEMVAFMAAQEVVAARLSTTSATLAQAVQVRRVS